LHQTFADVGVAVVVAVPEVVQPEEGFEVARGGVADFDGGWGVAAVALGGGDGVVCLFCPADGLVEVDDDVVVVYAAALLINTSFNNMPI
jgi:hypothetical protein